ncbi:MAG: hypothetical protein AB1584_01955 [Pseudomonadota bacterium]
MARIFVHRQQVGRGDNVVFKLNKVMEIFKPSAAWAFTAWLLQLLEQRHAATHTRYRELVEVLRHGAEGKRLASVRDASGICRKRAQRMLCATHIGMTALFLLLLSLMIGTLDAVLEADWLKLFGAPANMLRLLLVIPAAVLVIMDNMMRRKRLDTGLGGLHGRTQGGAGQQVPERRARERHAAGALPRPRSA